MSESSTNQGLILAVEDEPELLELLEFNLKKAGYRVLTATSGRRALDLAQQHSPDLILLDLMIPELSGTEVAGRLRSNPKTQSIPIVMVTAKAEEVDEIVGLTVGADDYVTKPYSMKVLLARMEDVLRRSVKSDEHDDQAPIGYGPVEINPRTHEARADGQLLKLTLTEFKLLEALVSGRGRVLSRASLMTHAMGPGVMVTQRTIDVHITAIRRKLEGHGSIVQTVRGVGYRLDPTIEAGVS
ncbi:MAG: response regulator [Salinibacterium sp.]|nr:response regulator [Salinibacterium sp.]